MAQTLIRGPYMNMATPHSIIIQWRTDMAINSRVQYGTDPNNLNMSAELPILTTEHSIKLINLMPDTKYYYNIGAWVFILHGNHQNYFRTAPVAHPKYNKPIRFWPMGDMWKAT
ncbi:MAG TPA: fibronectin type III domain-containing protein, partial [Chitinophagaceae bacterium]|nr:fibronectin type III domain-containing protein [Chitinophagaceae bacterium]